MPHHPFQIRVVLCFGWYQDHQNQLPHGALSSSKSPASGGWSGQTSVVFPFFVESSSAGLCFKRVLCPGLRASQTVLHPHGSVPSRVYKRQ